MQGAGLTAGFAKTVGVVVDRRRRNKSVEAQQENIQRLKEYRSKLILFPVHEKKKLRKGEATEEERKVATQLQGPVLPIVRTAPEIEFRKITEEEKSFNAYHTLRRVSITSHRMTPPLSDESNYFIDIPLTIDISLFHCRLALMLVWWVSVPSALRKPPKTLTIREPRLRSKICCMKITLEKYIYFLV